MTHAQILAAGFSLGPNGEYFKPGVGAPIQAHCAGPAGKLERNPGDGAVAALPVQGKIGPRFLVRLKSFRKRLLDEDNLCCKYYVDLLRYSGVIPSDAPGVAKIEVSQEKVVGKEPERTTIEIYTLD